MILPSAKHKTDEPSSSGQQQHAAALFTSRSTPASAYALGFRISPSRALFGELSCIFRKWA
jgi:hypothetical protein